MTALDRICRHEARRLALNMMEHREPHEVAELRDIGPALARLWEQRRAEMSGASHQQPADYKQRRAGLSSVENKVVQK